MKVSGDFDRKQTCDPQYCSHSKILSKLTYKFSLKNFMMKAGTPATG